MMRFALPSLRLPALAIVLAMPAVGAGSEASSPAASATATATAEDATGPAASTTPRSVPTVDPSCDEPGGYGDLVAVTNDGTILAGSIDCHEIWRFAPGASGNAAPSGVLTAWKNLHGEIHAIGTSGTHLLVAGFSSLGVFDEDASGNDGPLRYLGDGIDDTESKTGLQNPVGGPVGIFADGDGGLFVLENRAVHGYDGGPTVVRFAPGARGDVAPASEFDPTTLAKPAPVIPPREPGGNPDAPREGVRNVALGADGRLFVIDWYGNILASGPNAATPYKPIDRIAHVGPFLSLAVDGRGRFIVGNGDTIDVVAGALSGAPRETVIHGPKTLLGTTQRDGNVGVRSIGTDDAGSIYVLTCDRGNGHVLRFAADAAGDASPASVLGGPRTYLHC